MEICFHPEYQRTFLKLLIDTLDRIELNKTAHIHVIIATHSPFILSDIPSGNVLKIKDGRVCEKEETFGANIHTLLNSEFFLEYSIGDIAREKIQSLFCRARKGGKELDNDDLKALDYICNHIGDEYLKKQANKALYDILGHDELQSRLRKLDEERKLIEIQIEKRHNEENQL